jgi:chloramphenicol O-acetyltransferase type A
MKIIDIENWERKNHYNYFKSLDYPHFSLCANVDITNFMRFIKEKGFSFFISFLYVSTKTANDIKEFRLRIREKDVVEHETVSPSFTMMTSQNVFSFCAVRFINNFGSFVSNTAEQMDKSKSLVNVEDEPGRDDLLYITSIPWVSFTNITHPIHMNPVDSVPRISWGKYFEENGRVKIPLSIQAHHALVDGIHAGQYFMTIQEILDKPDKFFWEG